MLAGWCEFLLIGHSERRQLFGETDEELNRKVGAAFRHNLKVILAVGETLEEYEAGRTAEVITRQVNAALYGVDRARAADLSIAYEPVWAIGTGLTATPELAQDAHAFIKSLLEVPVLYGGSGKPENAAELPRQSGVDGALVGRAPLDVESFPALCQTAPTLSPPYRSSSPPVGGAPRRAPAPRAERRGPRA